MAEEDSPPHGGNGAGTRAKDRLEQISSHVSRQAVSSGSSSDAVSESASDTDTSTSGTTSGSALRRGGRRRRKSASSTGAADPPADYGDILGQVRTLRRMASATPDPAQRAGYARQKQAGKLWVRERVELMFDRGSVQEIGSASGTVDWKWRPKGSGAAGSGAGDDGVLGEVGEGAGPGDHMEEYPDSFIPSNNVQGLARVDGRKVCFSADDYTLRAGHADGALWEKTVSICSPCLYICTCSPFLLSVTPGHSSFILS